MSLADLAAYRTARDYPQQVVDVSRAFTLTSGTGWASAWVGTGSPATGVAPTSAVVPDNATAGSLGQGNASSGELRAMIRNIQIAINAGPAPGGLMLMLADRLSHKGSLDGTVNTAQTVSTAALTRFTDGVGVRAAIEVYTAIGATGTTATMDYTDDAGNTGNTSQPVVVGGAGMQNAGRFIPMSLAAGDRGVRAVNTVTLAASTGTAGAFGITLYKPLLYIPVPTSMSPFCAKADPIADRGFYMPKIPDGACLFFVVLGGGAAAEQITGAVRFFED